MEKARRRRLSQLKQFREEDTVPSKLKERDEEQGEATEIAAKSSVAPNSEPPNEEQGEKSLPRNQRKLFPKILSFLQNWRNETKDKATP